jgi:hypothetical protein
MTILYVDSFDSSAILASVAQLRANETIDDNAFDALTARVNQLQADISAIPAPVDLSSIIARLDSLDALKADKSALANLPTVGQFDPAEVLGLTPTPSVTVTNPTTPPANPTGINSAQLTDNWYLLPTTTGADIKHRDYPGILARIEFIPDGGYSFSAQGVYDLAAATYWMLTEYYSDRIGTASHTVMANSAALSTRSFPAATNTESVAVMVPFNGRIFRITRPHSENAAGWIRTQDTRTTWPTYVYERGSDWLKVAWLPEAAFLQVAGGVGQWTINGQTATQAAIASRQLSAPGYLLLENTPTQLTMVSPSGNAITLARSPEAITWQGCLEQFPVGWQASQPTISNTCFSQYRKLVGNEYLRLTWFPELRIEHVKNGQLQGGCWYRLSEPDGTVTTYQATTSPVAHAGKQVSLIEFWYEINPVAQFPGGAPNFVLPIPLLPFEQSLVPSWWTLFVQNKEFQDSAAGRAIADLKTQLATQITLNETQGRSINSLFFLIEDLQNNSAYLQQRFIDDDAMLTNAGGRTPYVFTILLRETSNPEMLNFRFRDWRTDQSARFIDVQVPFTYFDVEPTAGVIVGDGWKFASNKSAIEKTLVMPDNTQYPVSIEYRISPRTIALIFTDTHAGQPNSYGKVENISVTWT